jgi:hypothetical protein
VSPSLAKNVAICTWAASANGAAALERFVRNPCGLRPTAGFAWNARSLRYSVVFEARPPARMIADVVGFGTVMSPRANWRMIGRLTSDAYAAGLAACCAHSVRSLSCWIADAPGTVSTTGGRFRSGLLSTNDVNVGFGTAL